jgi:hypothetical protein
VPGKPIPERNPIGDLFTGFAIAVDGREALAVNFQPEAEIIARGNFVVRYGLRYLGKPFLSVVPGLVALDYGDFLTGEEAWDFLLKGSNLYPRSEVIGYRNDGRDEMIVIKALDMSLAPEVLAYHLDTGSRIPNAKPTALIAPPVVGIPARIREFLPCFANLTEWRSAL